MGLREKLGTEVPATSLAAFRIAFGVLMVYATARFASMGWIDSLYVAPSFHPTYFGFGWVQPLPAPAIYVHFALIGIAAALVALGLFYRVAIVVFTVLFTWAELLDAATYLNHYYAITLLGILLACMPAHRVWSLDAWWAARQAGAMERPTPTVPFWTVGLLRAQLGIVYFFAGLAKLGEDWLFRAEPLRTWLFARSDLSVIGPLLEQPATPFVMSWAGALFDLSIPFFLLHRATRPIAYVVVVLFHLLTGWLFPSIGVFPFVMIALTPIFFPPDWPVRLAGLVGRFPERSASVSAPRTTVPHHVLAWAALWLLVQVLLPLRHLAYPGDVLFTQEGMRFSWRVMVVERAAVAEVWTVDREGRSSVVDLEEYLTPLQLRMVAAEPDLLIQLAHHLADERRARGEEVEVHAEVWASLNGRAPQLLVDPRIDLAREAPSLLGHPWLRAAAAVGLSRASLALRASRPRRSAPTAPRP